LNVPCRIEKEHAGFVIVYQGPRGFQEVLENFFYMAGFLQGYMVEEHNVTYKLLVHDREVISP